MGTRLLRRRGLAAAGVLAAGVLSGCHSPNQFLHTGVARGDLVGWDPVPPAAGRIPSERTLAATPGAGGMMVVAGEPQLPTMTALMPTAPAAEPVPAMMTSGEIVSATAYPVPAAVAPTAPAAQTAVQAGATLPLMTMSVPTAASLPMPVQAVTVQTSGVSPAVQQAAIPGMPVTTTMAMPTTPMRGTGTPILMLIQGPNGPQYVITEVLSVVPLPSPTATPSPTPVAPPAPVTPVTRASMVAPPPIPPSTPVSESGPAPEVTPVALPPAEAPSPVKPAPDPMPTLTAPPPATVPALPPSPIGLKTPDPLPKTVSFKPSTGPALPPAGTEGPAITQVGGPKLPPTTAAVDDDIPAAPVFLPVAK